MNIRYIIWLGGTLIAATIAFSSYAQTTRPRIPPSEAVKIHNRGGSIATLATNYTNADIPEFMEVLNDDKTPLSEKSQAVFIIGTASSTNNEKVVEQLLDFLKRPVKWQTWATNDQNIYKIVTTKIYALQSIGMIGGPKALAILQRAITQAGAEEFAKAWMVDYPSNRPMPEDRAIGEIRAMAAMTLASHDETQDLVRVEYAKEYEACLKSGNESPYFLGLVNAMAKLEAYKEVGAKRNPRLGSLILEYQKHYKLPRITNSIPRIL